jgi:hypothetical protein
MSYPWPWLSQLEGGSGRNNCFKVSSGAHLMTEGAKRFFARSLAVAGHASEKVTTDGA